MFCNWFFLVHVNYFIKYYSLRNINVKKVCAVYARYMCVSYNQNPLNQTLLNGFNGSWFNQAAVATTSDLARK